MPKKEKLEKKKEKKRGWNLKSLRLTYPRKAEVAKTTAITVGVMFLGGGFIFLIDTATMYLFAIAK